MSTAGGIGVYAKAVAAFLIAGLTSLATALNDGHISAQEWAYVALAALATTGGVAAIPNSLTKKQAEEKDTVTARLDDHARVLNNHAEVLNQPATQPEPEPAFAGNGVSGYGDDSVLEGIPFDVPTSPPPSEPPVEISPTLEVEKPKAARRRPSPK